MQIKLIDPTVTFEDAGHGNAFAIKHAQEIPDDWLSKLKRKVLPTKWASGNYEHLFSIPTGVIEKWEREGVNYLHLNEREIASRLRAEGLDAFIVGRI